MDDIRIKCTRCRHVCQSSEWIYVPSKRYGGCTESTCPRCGCKSFYDMTPQVAWCWANGVIEIGDELPANQPDGSGPIQIASGPKYALRVSIEAVARHGYERGVLLVPGVPEATDPTAAVDALQQWVDWCRRYRKRHGVVFGGAA